MRLNVNLTYNTRQTRFIRQVYPRMTFCQANYSDFENSAIRDAEPQNFLNFARCAYAVQPVAALQSEYSIWWRAIEENDVLAICEELGTGLVPFSPLGRGYLTGKVDENTMYADNDIRSKNPRFAQEAIKSHIHLHGSPAPVRRFLAELIALIWNRKINPGKVFDLTLPLEQVADGYRALDERRAIKALLRPRGEDL